MESIYISNVLSSQKSVLELFPMMLPVAKFWGLAHGLFGEKQGCCLYVDMNFSPISHL